ncbi:MAG: cupin domain-containing protein [Deltaproteobacteria bacterium]|nr:cupin domain-containing protein [Deltaproteobacteria bacterium]
MNESAVTHARRVAKPWGYELIWAHTERYAGKILHIEQGHALSYQYHRQKDETIYLLSGRLQLEVAQGDEPPRRLLLSPGDSFRIYSGLRHRMVALESCDVLEASTPELDDVVRLHDNYGRAGSSKP